VKGGLEAARAAKEIAQFESNKDDLAPPPPYESGMRVSRRSTLRRKWKTHHDEEALKRELAEELRKGFEGSEKADPTTQACELASLLSSKNALL